MKALGEPAIAIKRGFLAEAGQLFLHLENTVAWDERMRARKTVSFGLPYNYSQISYPAMPMPYVLQEICQAIDVELGFLPNNCLVNFYPDGSSSMGFHSDSSGDLEPGTGVAIISLGSLRHIVYRNKADKTQEYRYALPAGTLLYMPDAIQQTWLHAIPKEEGVGERISLTFRKICE